MKPKFSKCAPALLLTIGLMGTQFMTSSTKLTYADNVDSDYHVGKYHLTTKDGWSNDLQTIAWNEQGQYYDIYFLHSQTADDPNEASHQNWYHTTTKDFIHFTPQNVAIEADGPDKPYTWSSAWTGTVITNNGQIKGVPKGAQVTYFSGLEKHDGGSQNIWAAYSTDGGKTFNHVLNDAKPVIDHSWNWTSANHGDERDPAVFYWNGKMLMYAAEGNEIGVYQSKDGINWSKADNNGHSKVLPVSYFKGLNSEDSFPVECPAVRTMKMPNGTVKTVLFYGAKAPKNGQTTGTYYIVGHLNKDGLFEPESDAKRLDQGSDYYGANYSGFADLSKPDTSIKSMGWVGNWSYSAAGVHNDEAAKSEFTKHLGSYSVARTLTLNNDMTISQTPITGKETNVKTYKNVSKDHPINNDNKPYTDGTDTNGPRYNLYDIANLDVNKEYDLDFFNTKGTYKGRIYFDIWQGKDYIKFNYDPSNGKYVVSGYSGELNNSRNGQGASSYYYDGMLGDGHGYSADSGVKNELHIKIKALTDKNSVEIFFPNGQSYTVARFNSSDKQDFKIFTEDPTGGNRVNITQSDLGYTPYAKSFSKVVRVIHFVDNNGKKVAHDIEQIIAGRTTGYEQDVNESYHDTKNEDIGTGTGEVKVPNIPGYKPNISIVPKYDGKKEHAEVTVVYTPIKDSKPATTDSKKDDKTQGNTTNPTTEKNDSSTTSEQEPVKKDYHQSSTSTQSDKHKDVNSDQTTNPSERNKTSKQDDHQSTTGSKADREKNEKPSQEMGTNTDSKKPSEKTDTSSSTQKDNHSVSGNKSDSDEDVKPDLEKGQNTTSTAKKDDPQTSFVGEKSTTDQNQGVNNDKGPDKSADISSSVSSDQSSKSKRYSESTSSQSAQRTSQRDATNSANGVKTKSESPSTPLGDTNDVTYAINNHEKPASTDQSNSSNIQATHPGISAHTRKVQSALNKEKKHEAIALLPQTGDKQSNWLILTVGSALAAIGLFFADKFKKKD